MDELEIKGKKYISSKRASELTGYAKDYVGQLARSGKISGTRMGRAWFIEEEALLRHKNSDQGLLSTIVPEEQKAGALASAPARALAPLPVQKRRPLSPAIIKALGYVPKPLPSSWKRVEYFSDEGELFPRPRKAENALQNGAVQVPVTLIEARQIPKAALHIPAKLVATKSMTGIRQPVLTQIRKNSVATPVTAVTKQSAPLYALAAAVLVLGFFVSGMFVSSNTIFQGANGAYSANLLVGFEYARDFLLRVPPFVAGISAIGNFFSVLSHSFSMFLREGLLFFVSLWHFLF